jgi:HlyD family secretion protein
MTGRRKLIIGVLVLLVVVAATVYSLSWWQGRQPKNLLRLQGHMEATETDLSFKVSGLIEYIFFQEGDWVNSGRKAAGLEAKDLKDEVDRARADMQASKANLTKLETGYRPQEVKEAEAQVGKTKADLDNKKLEYERYQNLLLRQVVAAQTRDKFLSDYLQAKET